MTLKRRIFYRADSTIRAIVCPAPKGKLSNETEAEWLERIYLDASVKGGFSSLDYDDVLITDLPDKKVYPVEKWRGNKGNPITIDNTVETDAEKRQKIEDDLDAELAKQNPNAVAALKLQRKLDKREYD